MRLLNILKLVFATGMTGNKADETKNDRFRHTVLVYGAITMGFNAILAVGVILKIFWPLIYRFRYVVSAYVLATTFTWGLLMLKDGIIDSIRFKKFSSKYIMGPAVCIGSVACFMHLYNLKSSDLTFGFVFNTITISVVIVALLVAINMLQLKFKSSKK